MTMSIPLERGQVFYWIANPARRVVVLTAPAFLAGRHLTSARVATYLGEGRYERVRVVQAIQFHQSATTGSGKVRKRGYILEGRVEI